MMRSAKASAIGGVIGSATVAHLDDMIGEHAMAGLCLDAPTSGALIDVLAPSACPTDHRLSPRPVLRGQVERVRSLWLRLDGPRVNPVGDERTDLPHEKGHRLRGRIRRRPKSEGGNAHRKGSDRGEALPHTLDMQKPRTMPGLDPLRSTSRDRVRDNYRDCCVTLTVRSFRAIRSGFLHGRFARRSQCLPLHTLSRQAR